MRPQTLDDLRKLYDGGAGFSANALARRLNRRTSTVHDALTIEGRDPGYQFVLDMIGAVNEMLDEAAVGADK